MLLKELIDFNQTLPIKKRIPYNMTPVKHKGTIRISDNFKKIEFIISSENSKIITEFSNNRSGKTSYNKAKLGIDDENYVLGICINEKKHKSSDLLKKFHKAYIDKLSTASHIPYIQKIIKFMKYYDTNADYRKKIKDEFLNVFKNDREAGAVVFDFYESFDYALDKDPLFIKHVSQKPSGKYNITCCICGSTEYPVKDIIVPKMFPTSGVMFSSNFSNVPTQIKYSQLSPKERGSEQAGVCSSCYFQGYSAGQYLIYNGHKVTIKSTDKGKKKEKNILDDEEETKDKEIIVYSNKIRFSDNKNEHIIFWTPKNHQVPELISLTEKKIIPFTKESVHVKAPVKSNGVNLSSEINSVKTKGKAIFADDNEICIIASINEEQGPLNMSAPSIGLVSKIRENIKQWEKDVTCLRGIWNDEEEKFDEQQWVKPTIRTLANALKDVHCAEKMLFEIAIKNKPLDINYMPLIFNSYMYDKMCSSYTVVGLINLINRRKRMIDDRYINVGRLFSLLKSVRYKVKATGRDNFERDYLPSISRMPKFVLQRLLEENTYQMGGFDKDSQKLKNFYEKEIMECADKVKLNTLSVVTSPVQMVDIMTGYLKSETERISAISEFYAKNNTNKES